MIKASILIGLMSLAGLLGAASTPPKPDPKAGAKVFISKTCGVCHSVKSLPQARGTLGPRLDKIGSFAGKRVAGQTADVYLRKAILEPNVYIVPDYQPIMPALGATMTEKELRDLLAFLKSLK